MAALSPDQGRAGALEERAAGDAGPRAEIRSIARGGALNLVGAGTSAVLNVALVLAVTRGLPQAVAGVFFSVTSLFLLLAALGRLGSGTGLVYFVARFRALGASSAIEACVRLAARSSITAAVLGAVALLVSAPAVADLLSADNPGPAADYLRQLAVFLPCAVLAEVFQAAHRGFGSMTTTVVVEKIGRPLLQLLLVAAAATAGGALLGLAWAAPYVPAALLAWLRLRRRRARLRPAQAEPPPEAVPARLAREYWRFSGPRALAALAQVALQRLDILLIGALRGPAEAAVYAAATRFLVVGQLANQAIATAVQPQVSRLLAQRRLADVRTVYAMSTAWLVALAWPLYLLCATFASAILGLFGQGYGAGTTVVVVLALAMLVATGCGSVDVVLAMAGRTSWNLANVSLALAVNVGVDLLLIPRLGILGAAIGWAAAIVANNVVPLAQLTVSMRLHPFGFPLAWVALLATACFGLLPLLARLAGGSSPLPVVLATLLGGLAYAAGLWWRRRELHLHALGASLTTALDRLRGRGR